MHKINYNNRVKKRIEEHEVDVNDLCDIIFSVESGDAFLRHKYRRHKMTNSHYKDNIAIHYRNDLIVLYTIRKNVVNVYDVGTHRQVLKW